MALGAQERGVPRNPGPSWGYRFLRAADRWAPEAVFRPARWLGTWAAVVTMPEQRLHSRAYLARVLGRPPSLADIHRHFFAVCEALMLRLRIANGELHTCILEPGAADFGDWLASDRPAFLGTFHIGNSDLTGFMLAGQGRKRVSLVRLRMGNSHDTEALAAQFGDKLRFVWVNEPSELIFALKEAAAGGEVVALQCDRTDRSARCESFEFLGGQRLFPFTIYHLAFIFSRPVLLSFGIPAGPHESLVRASPRFEPIAGETREQALARARDHFQSFLRRVEAHLREHPHQWLNFLPL